MSASQGVKGEGVEGEDAPLLPVTAALPKAAAASATAPAVSVNEDAKRTKTTVAILMYASASSVMLVLNKAAVNVLPAPASLLFVQLAATALLAVLLREAGVVEADRMEWDKVRRFGPVAMVFLSTIFTNIKTLQHSSVNFFIVLRCSTPLVIAFLDYIFLGRELPSPKSWVALLGIFVGAVLYVVARNGIPAVAMGWAFAWYATFSLDMVYIKHVVDTVSMKAWGRVYYQNALALPLLAIVFVLGGEYKAVGTEWDVTAILIVAGSCVVGASLSYSAYTLRALVSATTFTVVGIVCKMATILIASITLANEGTSLAGYAGLMLCVLASTVYEQSPKRAVAAPSALAAGDKPVELTVTVDSGKDEKQPLKEESG